MIFKNGKCTMKNISIENEPIELRVGVKYIVIDGLYIENIKQERKSLMTGSLADDSIPIPLNL